MIATGSSLRCLKVRNTYTKCYCCSQHTSTRSVLRIWSFVNSCTYTACCYGCCCVCCCGSSSSYTCYSRLFFIQPTVVVLTVIFVGTNQNPFVHPLVVHSLLRDLALPIPYLSRTLRARASSRRVKAPFVPSISHQHHSICHLTTCSAYTNHIYRPRIRMLKE